jgi:hypothetical protein
VSRRPLALLALCALGLVAVPAAADWKRDYGFGQQAYEKGNYAEAEQLMKSALAEEPAASARKRMQGTRFELYAPAHYAALAAWKQGACGRALQYLEDGPTRAVAAQVASVGAEEQQVRSACGGAAVAAEPPKPVPAPPVATPTPTPPKPPVVADKPPVIAAEPPKPTTRPVETPPAPTPAVGGAPPLALRLVVRAFIAGDYAGATKVNEADVADPRARALVLLVRGAAWATRAELAGDAAMRTRAQQDIRASRRLARIDPDPTLFSPRVRALIAATK